MGVPPTRRRRSGVLLLVCPVLAAFGAACDGPAAPPPGESSTVARPSEARQIDPPAAAGALAPNLAVAGETVLLSWLEPRPRKRHRLRLSRLTGDGWSPPETVVEGERFFANWADLPAVTASGDGSLVAHWLAKTGDGAYDYSIFLARSTDGASWARLGALNDDEVAAEHGFVSYARVPDGLRAFWLDGRAMPAGRPMGLRTAVIGETVGPSELLDERVCECCATDAAAAAGGPVVVYRDRDGDELRDISVVRRRADGWSAPRPAAVDGWKIAGCPVNGPAIDAAGESAVVAWFTAGGEAPRVLAAFSANSGATFGSPVTIDDASPLGRVDVTLDGAGGAIVAWLAAAGDEAAVRLVRVGAEGARGSALELATTGAARASGFPRLARRGDTLVVVWVDTAPADGHRIRGHVLPVDAVPATGR